MSTPRTTDRFPLVASVGVGCAMAVIAPGALLLREHGPGHMWLGFLVGGTVALVGSLVAGWRTYRRPERATAADRAFAAGGDERDRSVLTRSLAVVGLLSLPLTSVACVAVAVDADALAVVGALTVALLAALVVAFIVYNRRT
jgi:peptidoglycan/LPS O-acetylase OafA/YrhL